MPAFQTFSDRFESFCERWPAIADCAIPELAEVLAGIDQRQRIRRAISPFIEALSGLAAVGLIALLVASCWGIFLVAVLILCRLFTTRHTVWRHISAPFCLSQRIISSRGYLALDCAMAALSCREIIATEAAAAWMLRRGFAWFRILVFASLALLVFYGAIRFLDLSHIGVWMAAVSVWICAHAMDRMTDELQMIKRICMTYDACSVGVTAPSLLSRVKPVSRMLAIPTMIGAAAMFVLAVGGTAAVLATMLDSGSAGLLAFPVWMPVFASFVIPDMVTHTYALAIADGEDRLEQLIETLSEQTG